MKPNLLWRAICGAALLGATLAGGITLAAETANPIEAGKALAFETSKGNCLACHLIVGGEAPGGIGPPLMAMQVRFPDKSALRLQIVDPTLRNPETLMPPFGKHGILTEAQIDQVVEFIWSL